MQKSAPLIAALGCLLALPCRAQTAAPAPGSAGAAATLPASPSLLRGSSVASPGPGQFLLAPRWRLVLNNLLVVRLNPVGIEDQIRFGLQRRLSDKTSPLFRDTFIFFGIAPRINPAFVKIGPSLEIQPVSIFNLRLAAEYIGLFSTFGFLQSYPSAADEYDDRTIANCARPELLKSCRHRDPAGVEQVATEQRNYRSHGLHVMIEPLIQAKYDFKRSGNVVGSIALRNKMAFEYWLMGVRGGDTVFYDVTLDTLVPANGWVMANDLDLLFLTRFGLIIGARYSIVHPFYTSEHFRTGEDRALGDNGHQRIGPIIAYTFFDRGFTRFNKPTLLLIANWYLDHRYRLGQAPTTIIGSSAADATVQSAGMPYIVLGFSFQSDLWQRR